MYLKKVSSCATQLYFGLFDGQSSDLHTRTHERKCTVIYIILERERERSSFTQMYKTGKKMYVISDNNIELRYLQKYMQSYMLKQEYN